MTRGCLNPDRGLPSVSYESLIDDPGLVSRMSEVDRMVRLCEGAMVGFCSITVREDALDASAEAAERLEGVPEGGKAAASSILDVASSIDPWYPWSMADLMGEEPSGKVISRILGSSSVWCWPPSSADRDFRCRFKGPWPSASSTSPLFWTRDRGWRHSRGTAHSSAGTAKSSGVHR